MKKADGKSEYNDYADWGEVESGTTTKSVLREYHPRQWVDSSSPAYTGSNPGIPVSLSFSPLAARGERRKKQRGARGSLDRLGLNDPHTAVWGIYHFSYRQQNKKRSNFKRVAPLLSYWLFVPITFLPSCGPRESLRGLPGIAESSAPQTESATADRRWAR